MDHEGPFRGGGGEDCDPIIEKRLRFSITEEREEPQLLCMGLTRFDVKGGSSPFPFGRRMNSHSEWFPYKRLLLHLFDQTEWYYR